MRRFPRWTVRFEEHRFIAGTASRDLLEKCCTLIGQHDVTRFARLALPDLNGANVRVESRIR